MLNLLKQRIWKLLRINLSLASLFPLLLWILLFLGFHHWASFPWTKILCGFLLIHIVFLWFSKSLKPLFYSSESWDLTKFYMSAFFSWSSQHITEEAQYIPENTLALPHQSTSSWLIVIDELTFPASICHTSFDTVVYPGIHHSSLLLLNFFSDISTRCCIFRH